MVKKKCPSKSKVLQLNTAAVSHKKIGRKQVGEKNMQKKQGEFNLAFDAITDPIIIFDAEFNITKINKAARKFFKGNPVGKQCFFTEHKFTSACKDCPTWQTLKTRDTTTSEILNLSTGSPLLIKTYPIYNKQKKFKGVILIGRDSKDIPIKWMR